MKDVDKVITDLKENIKKVCAGCVHDVEGVTCKDASCAIVVGIEELSEKIRC